MMRQRRLSAIAGGAATGLILILFGAANFAIERAAADVVYLKSGQKLEGLSQPDPNNNLNTLVITHTARISLSNKQIEKVEKEPEHVGYYKIGMRHFDEQKFEPARENLLKAQELAPDDLQIQEALRKTDAAIANQLQNRRNTELTQIELKMQEAQQFLAEDRFERAETVLEEARSLAPNAQQQEKLRDLAVELNYQWARDYLDHLDETGAVAKLEAAHRLNPDFRPVFTMLIKLYENDPAKSGEVLAYWQSALERNPGDQEARLRVAGSLFRQEQYAAAFEHYQQLFLTGNYAGTDVEANLRFCFDRLHAEAGARKDFQEAIRIYKDYAALFPGIDAEPLLVYEFFDKYTQLDPGDQNGLAQLGNWARENGLHDKAEELYRQALRADEKNTLALTGIGFYAVRDLTDARAQFSRKNYLGALNLSEELMKNYAMLPDVIKDAEELYERSQVEYQRVLKTREEQAEEHVRQGEVYNSQALSYMNQIGDADYDVVRRRNLAYNPRHEATKYFNRAIEQWKKALTLDPATNAKYDLRNKIADANSYIDRLNRGPGRLPRSTRQSAPGVRSGGVTE